MPGRFLCTECEIDHAETNFGKNQGCFRHLKKESFLFCYSSVQITAGTQTKQKGKPLK